MFRIYSLMVVVSICFTQLSCFEKEIINTASEKISLPLSFDNILGSWVFNDKCINLKEDQTYTLDFEGKVNISSKGTWSIDRLENTSSQVIGEIIFNSNPEGIADKSMFVLHLSENELIVSISVETSNDIGSFVFQSMEQRVYIRK